MRTEDLHAVIATAIQECGGLSAEPNLLQEAKRALAWLERLQRIAPEHDNVGLTARLRQAIRKENSNSL